MQATGSRYHRLGQAIDYLANPICHPRSVDECLQRDPRKWQRLFLATSARRLRRDHAQKKSWNWTTNRRKVIATERPSSPAEVWIQSKDNRSPSVIQSTFLYVNLPLGLLASRIAVTDRWSNSDNNK
jgi:hypothetical protein